MEDREKNENDGGKLEFHGLGGGAESARGKWENFWYYNKWKVIIAAFLSVILIICIVQFVSRDSPDIYVMYAGPSYLSAGDVDGVRFALRSVIDDYNGDGKTGASLLMLTYLSDEQINERTEAAIAESIDVYIDRQANQQSLKQFEMEIFGGESVICLLDPGLYERVHEAGGFLRMDEVFSEDEVEALDLYDACGIKFSSLPFADYFSAFRSLPEDTVLCIRKVSTISVFKGKKKYEKLHEQHVDAFRRIVGFEYPEGYVPETGAET